MYLFSSGTARGGTGLPVNILGSHPNVSLSQDPFLPLWKHFRSDLLSQYDLCNILASKPLDDYYYCSKKISYLDCIQASNLSDVRILDLPSIKSSLYPRTSLSSANLAEYIERLNGSNYYDLIQSCLDIISVAWSKSSNNIIGFNENWSIEFFPALARAFPSAKFIIYIRDLRASLASHIKLKEKNPDSKMSIALMMSFSRAWRKHIALAIKYMNSPLFEGRIKIVQYEELVRTPISVVPSLCKFLGIEYMESMLDTDNFKMGTGGTWKVNSNHADAPPSGIFTDSINKWVHTIPSGLLALSELVAGLELKKLNYNPISDNIDSNNRESFQYHVHDASTCLGWRNDSGNCLVDISLEHYRNKCLTQLDFCPSNFCKELFLTPELYSWINSNDHNDSIYSGAALCP